MLVHDMYGLSSFNVHHYIVKYQIFNQTFCAFVEKGGAAGGRNLIKGKGERKK